MQQTALLHHMSDQGSHYDWLISPPCPANTADVPLLWAGRVEQPTDVWRSLPEWPVLRLADHRRLYLTYEGPLTDGRGTVRRVDHGTVVSRLWTDRRLVLHVTFGQFVGQVTLNLIAGNQWQAIRTEHDH